MSVLDFGVEVIAISASGVLAPGPLFFTNLLYGTRQGARSGIKVAYGHTVVELPLIIMLAAGLFASTATNQYPGAIGLAGGIGILGFAGLQIASVVSKRNVLAAPVMASDKSPFVTCHDRRSQDIPFADNACDLQAGKTKDANATCQTYRAGILVSSSRCE